MTNKERAQTMCNVEISEFEQSDYRIEITKKEIIKDCLHLWIKAWYRGKYFSVNNPFIYPNPPTSKYELQEVDEEMIEVAVPDPTNVFKQMICDTLEVTEESKWVKNGKWVK